MEGVEEMIWLPPPPQNNKTNQLTNQPCNKEASKETNWWTTQPTNKASKQQTTNNLTNQPTVWRWGLLVKPPVAQPLKDFPIIYETWRFITVFTRDSHWSLSWARWIQSVPPYPISLRSILILSSHLRLGLPSGLFSSDFLTKILYHACDMPFPSHTPWLWRDHSNYIWRRVQIMKFLIMQFSPVSYYFTPLRPKYFFLRLVLKCSSLDVTDKVSQPYKTAGKSYLNAERKQWKTGKNL
jgi:hypothetical protein